MLISDDFQYSIEKSSIGIYLVEKLLRSIPSTIDIKNVEYDKTYQDIDIDLLRIYRDSTDEQVESIEVKSEFRFNAHYFFEYISNSNTKSLGCFYKSKADYWYYVFVLALEVHILPFEQVKQWVEDNWGRLERKVHPASQNQRYDTVGKKVFTKMILSEIPEIKVISLKEHVDEKVMEFARKYEITLPK